jgi:hypothetical protein
MKASRVLCFIVSALVTASSALALSNDPNSRAYMGVWLDPRPLSGVVTKNLGLRPGQGLRIENIHDKGPADKAGLEPDDIIISYQGHDVNDLEDFIETVSRVGIGKKVSLEVIHLGHRQTVTLTLAPSYPKGFVPKYPSEPQKHVWKPGRFFRFDPKSGQWVDVPFPGPPDVNELLPSPFTKEVYTFNYGQGQDQVTVIIEGNPYSGESTLIVRSGQSEYKSTLSEKDSKLPEAYRDRASQAIQDARRNSRRPDRNGPSWRGRGPRPEGRDSWQYPDGLQREEFTRWMLDRAKEHLESMDKDQLSFLKERLNQLQAQIDQVQHRSANEAIPDPNHPKPSRP